MLGMNKKDKKKYTEQKDIVKKENRRIKKLSWFVFIILFTILAIIQLFQYLNKVPVVNIDPPSISNEVIQAPEAQVEQTENIITEDLLSYEEDFCNNLYDDLYEDEIAYNDCFDYLSSTGFTNKLKRYRVFLANADKMISKFRNNENYENELKHISEIEHPEEIKDILNMLKIYNDQLVQEHNSTQEIILFPENKFLSKLFKITKISEEDNQNIKMKKQIHEKLKIFSNYIYTEELQDKFLNN